MKRLLSAQEITDLLDTVLPQYPKASTMPNEADDKNWYKSMNWNGDIFLIKNPAAREIRKTENGDVVVVIKPHPMGNIFEMGQVAHKATFGPQRNYRKKSEQGSRTEMHPAGSIIDMSKF